MCCKRRSWCEYEKDDEGDNDLSDDGCLAGYAVKQCVCGCVFTYDDADDNELMMECNGITDETYHVTGSPV